MSKRAKLIEETKKEILSLLISLGATRQNPGIPLQTFNSDYRGIVGSPIPYKELGFATLEDFFHQIPDTVSLVWSNSGPAVKAVENESVSHIVKLVDNQRNKTAVTRNKKAARGGYRGGGYRGGGRGGRGGGWGSGRFSSTSGGVMGGQSQAGYGGGPSVRYTAPPRFHERFSMPKPQPKPTPKPTPPAPAKEEQKENFIPPPERVKPCAGPQPTSPTVPALTRGMIRELLTAYPNGIYGQNVDMAFSKRFGQTLNPCKLGFKNLYAMFSALKDIVTLEDLDDDFRIRQVDLVPMARRQRTRVPDAGGDRPISPSSNENENSPPSKAAEKRSSRDYVDEDVLKEDIREVLSHHLQTGIWTSEFSKYFKDLIGVDLPLRQLGYTSVIELMDEMSDVVVIARESPHDWKLYDCKHPPAKSPVKSPAGSIKASSVRSDSSSHTRLPELSAGLREAVRQVVCSHSDEGLPINELPEIFKEMVGKPLPIQEIGYPSLDSLVQRLVANKVIRQEVKGKGLVLLRAVDQTPSTSHLLNKPGLGQQPERHSVPADAVGPGVKYTLMEPPKSNQYVEVFVCHVSNPTHFWLQLKGERTTIELEYLMDDLEDIYYGPNSNKYLVPESLLVADLVCVAIFPTDSNWHRVTIERIINEDFVEVYFVDYGGTCSVHKQNLRLLKNRFLKHPAQALLARLVFLKPTTPEGWSKAATRRMLNLTSGRALLALINSVDQERQPTDMTSNFQLSLQNQVLQVCLCDTNGKEDLHIQDELVEEGHARFEFEDAGEGDQSPANQGDNAGTSPATGGLTVVENAPMKKEEGGWEKPMSSQEELSDNNIAYVSPMKRTEGADNVSTEDVYIEEEDMEPRPTCVKFVELTEAYSIHIINYEDCPYVLSSEISAFLWDKDLLRSMLRQKRIDIPRKVLPCEEYADLFEEFIFYGISGVTDRDGKQKSHLTMYSLTHIPQILDVFNHPTPDLKAAIIREISTFNPDDTYWRGEEEDFVSDVTSDSESYTYGTSHLQVGLKSLQYRRKKIVEEMTMAVKGDSKDTQKLVEEMSEVEAGIARVRSLMEDAQKREAKTDEEFIQQCIAEQYKVNESTSIQKAQPQQVNPAYHNPSALPATPVSSSMPYMTPGFNTSYGVGGPGFGMGQPGFGGVQTSNTGNPMDMSLMMSSLLMSTGGVANVPPMAGTMPNTAGLSLDQQQFLMQYQMLLGQQAQMQQTQMQMAAGNPLMNMNMSGLGFPGMNLMNPAGGVNPGQMSMADMSVLLLGQGRGVPGHLQQHQGPRPGGLQ